MNEGREPVRVLIADDDAAFSRALADLLTAFGHADASGSRAENSSTAARPSRATPTTPADVPQGGRGATP